MLNKAARAGLSESLTQEKLGWHDQRLAYFLYGVYFSLFSAENLLRSEPPIQLADLAALVLFCHPWTRFWLLSHPPFLFQEENQLSRRSWKEAWLPLVPVDKWIIGQILLLRHGEKMVVFG